jgi:hypothetical protein
MDWVQGFVPARIRDGGHDGLDHISTRLVLVAWIRESGTDLPVGDPDDKEGQPAIFIAPGEPDGNQSIGLVQDRKRLCSIVFFINERYSELFQLASPFILYTEAPEVRLATSECCRYGWIEGQRKNVDVQDGRCQGRAVATRK